MTNVNSPTLPRRTLASRLAGVLTLVIALSVMGALYAAMAPGTRAAQSPYSPKQIAAVACAGVNRPMVDRMSRYTKATRPPMTCRPWNPVAR